MAKKRGARPDGRTTKAGRGKKAGQAKKNSRRSGGGGTASSDTGLLTLTEVSRRTGISMPTLQRYKKEYQSRLQAVGEGRKQRYKVASLATFKRIKTENLKKRGRPRKTAVASAAKRAKATPEGLISLSEIGRRTGISYPTLLRYVRLHDDRIPSHGTGRKRRFPVAAVPVFSQLRQESRRGRRRGSTTSSGAGATSGLEARLKRLEKSHAALERQMKKLVRVLQKPLVKGV